MQGKVIQYGDYVEVYAYQREFYGGRPRREVVSVEGSDDVTTAVVRHGWDKATQRLRSNVYAMRKHFIRLCTHGLTSFEGKPLFVTFTFDSDVSDASDAYVYFRLAMQRYRRRFGSDYTYIAVPEKMKNGRVHFHALMWGIPEVYGDLYVNRKCVRIGLERKSRLLAALWGHGFVDVKRTDGNEKLAFYMSKYMSKAFDDPCMVNVKAFTRSRNFETYFVYRTHNLDTVVDSLGLDTYTLVYTAEFSNRYTGNILLRILRNVT